MYVYVCVPSCKLTEVRKKKKSMNSGNFADVGDKREGQGRDEYQCFIF